MRKLFLLPLFLVFVATPVFAQVVVDLLTWNGNKRSWELGTETRLNEQRIVPMVGALSEDGSALLKIYPQAETFTSTSFHPIPGDAVLPIRDVSLQTFITNDSMIWVEDWPSNDDPPVLARLTGLPPAHYAFDFGGLSNSDERWQWMMTYEDTYERTMFYNVSYSTPTLVAQFPGQVINEPRMHETRRNGQLTDFQVMLTWPTENMDGMVLLNPSSNQPDTLDWDTDQPYSCTSMTWCPRLVNSNEPTMYGIAPVSGNTYELIHKAGGEGYIDRFSIDSQLPPRLMTTPEYQKTNLLDADFVAWVERVNGVDVIRWVRFQYQFGYDAPVTYTGTIVVDGSVNRLRAQYASGEDNEGTFDSWYLVWSEYDDENDITHLRSAMVERDPNFNDVPFSSVSQPATIRLLPAYPNPFNASTVIPFELNRAGHVRVAAFDLLGREVGILVDRKFGAGHWVTSWVPNKIVASGTYMIRLDTPYGTQVQRITLVQ